MNAQERREKRMRRHRRVRARIIGTAQRPRLSVFKSLRHISAQLIDDEAGITIAAARDGEGSSDKKKTRMSKGVAALEVGALIAKRAQEKNISRAVFDRGGYRYHGAVASVADGARKGGIAL